MKEYDMVIIGTGVGLSILSAALQKGLKCAIIENEKFGGTCLTRGCIPSKILVHPADLIREMEHAKKIGLESTIDKIDWDIISQRMWSQIDESKDIELSLTSVETLEVYKGQAEFSGPYRMKVRLGDGSWTPEFGAKKFVIAAGGRSSVPLVTGLEKAGYLTYETFFGEKFPNKPWKSLAIIGGGAIGAEFAHIFSAYGTKVTIIKTRPRLVSKEDAEISEILETVFRKNGIDVYTDTTIDGIITDGVTKTVRLTDNTTGMKRTVPCEEILVATGIKSNADILKVDKAGIETNEKGWIITNEYLETSQVGIWALGDINGKFQFRHKANQEADVCSNNIFSEASDRRQVDYTKVPWAIFTNPQIAHVGMTEAETRKRHKRFLVGKNYYSATAAGFAMGYSNGDDDDGFIKLLADEKRKILGVHIIGPQAAVLIQAFVYLMNSESGTIDPLYDSMVIHPSMSEIAAWVIGNMKWAM